MWPVNHTKPRTDTNGWTVSAHHGGQPSSIPIGGLGRVVSQGKLTENSGTEGALRGHGPPFKNNKASVS
jgi:hypothetical protein